MTFFKNHIQKLIQVNLKSNNLNNILLYINYLLLLLTIETNLIN